jgi:RHS repeat-associated protein
VTNSSVTESYSYDADGERVATTVNGVTTVYFQGLWEQIVGGASKRYYTVGGQVVAMRASASNAVTYLHGDHLGSVSLATNSSGAIVSKQDFDPWGAVRAGSMGTTLNYTGQRLDGTGLLYYHARYYNPLLSRFISADTIVPGVASGKGAVPTLGMDSTSQLKALTVDFHEPSLSSRLNAENALAFWFQMNNDERQQAGSPWGPANPQALNRYSYVLNNPLRYTDPTGHSVYMTKTEATAYVAELRQLAQDIRKLSGTLGTGGMVVGGVGGLAAASEALKGLVKRLGIIAVAVGISMEALAAALPYWADSIDEIANYVEEVNNVGGSGVIIAAECSIIRCKTTIVSRNTGNGYVVPTRRGAALLMFFGETTVPFTRDPGISVWSPGYACTRESGNPSAGNYYGGDHTVCNRYLQ